MKIKAKLAKGIPNSFITCTEIYALKSIAQAQSSTLTLTVQRNLNNTNFDNSFFKIRLQQLQDAAMTNISILQRPPVFPLNQIKTHTCQAIMACHEMGIQFEKKLSEWPTPKKLLGTSINEIILYCQRGSHYKQYLNKHNIICIEQFLSTDNKNFLLWEQLHHSIKKIPTGKKPKWFNDIQNLISAQENPTFTLKYPNPYTLPKWTPNTKGWLITARGTIAKAYKSIHN